MCLKRGLSALAIGVALAACRASGDDLPRPIDLTSFGQGDLVDTVGLADDLGSGFDGGTTPTEPMPVAAVGNRMDTPANRLYVSGIAGASFATMNTGGGRTLGGTEISQAGSLNETIFTGGGAIGSAFARRSGLLRMEVEGRARGPMSGQTDLLADGALLTPLDVRVPNSWSAMVNFWRDYFLTDAVGIYAGGGFGVGGYQYSLAAVPDPLAPFPQLSGSSTNTTFAWQVGAGVVYEINDRIAFDTSYRFFAMTPESTAMYVPDAIGVGSFTSAFSSSELLLSIRIYEPFRRWR